MRNIRFKNANVFKLVYDLYGTDYVSASTTASASSFTGRDYYAYLNKYLNNDDMYTAVSAYSGDLEYVLFRRSDGSFSGDPRVLTLSYTGASVGFSAT
jgi:hypothetical protein